MAVITGIIDGKFVVIMKQDRSNEVVRVEDIVLGEKVYDLEQLEKSDFYNSTNNEQLSDFDRYKLNLRKQVVDRLLREQGYHGTP
ncbi:hypothetical protein EBI_26964, partial [Enterocytozoon bieneusi H348]